MTNKFSKSSDLDGRKKLVFSDYACLLSVVLLCLSICRGGHEEYAIPTIYSCYIIIALNAPNFRKLSFKPVMPALPFALVLFPLLIIQALTCESYFSISSAFWAVILFLLFAFCAMLLLCSGLEAYIWKIINAFTVAASIVIVFEYIAFMFGVRLYTLPGLGDWIFNAWEFSGVGAFRPCAFFSEASHFAELGLFSAYYYLFIRRSFPKFLIIAVGCLASTSSLGIIGCAALFFAYLFIVAFSKNYFKTRGFGKTALIVRLFLIIFIVIMFLLVAWYLQVADTWLTNRLLDGGTSSTRVVRSYELFNLMDPAEQFFGIGLQNQAIYLNANGIILPSDFNETLTNREFAASLGYVLCTCGIVGIVAFAWIFVSSCLDADKKKTVLVILTLYILATCCVFSRAMFIFILYFCLVDINKINVWYKNVVR